MSDEKPRPTQSDTQSTQTDQGGQTGQTIDPRKLVYTEQRGQNPDRLHISRLPNLQRKMVEGGEE